MRYIKINTKNWPEAWSSANYGMPEKSFNSLAAYEFKDRVVRNYYKQEFPALLDRFYQELLDKADIIDLKGGSHDEMVEFMEEDLASPLIDMIFKVAKALGKDYYYEKE